METKRFHEIRQYIEDNAKNKDSLWLIGERKWSLKLHKQILDAEDNNKLPLPKGETGVFLNDNFDWDKFEDDYADCTRLVFFNSEEQFQFIATDNRCYEYIYYHSQIKEKKMEPLRTIMDKDNNHYRFNFAQRLGAIHKLNQNNKVQVIVDENKKEWRLWHD